MRAGESVQVERAGERVGSGFIVSCPFLPTAPPCQADSACAGVEWGVPGSQSHACEEEIVAYCQNAFDFEADELGCTEFLDLFADCSYTVDVAEQEFILQGVREGRQGRGIVYVMAAGNDFVVGENTNAFGNTHNTRLVINVGSVGKDDVVSTYSARGSGLFVVAPGGDREFWSNHVVAVNAGDCEDAGVGTSFAAPVVSGVAALILQANGNLSYRDVQGIIATTATQVNPTDDSWVVNAVNISHSNEYGFGVINAGAAVEAAQTWELYSEERWNLAHSGAINLQLPEYTPTSDPVTSTVTMDAPSEFVIESVYVYVKLTHSSRGDLQITLTSPSGTSSVVHPWGRPENGNSPGYWKFTTWKNFGESATGDWTLSIEDRSAGDLPNCFDDLTYSVEREFPVVEGPITVDCALLDAEDFCQDERTSLGGRPVSGPDDQFFADADGTTPADACCSCGGGRTCVDNHEYFFPYEQRPGEFVNVDCSILDSIEFCQDGATSFVGIPVNGANDPFLQGTNGLSPYVVFVYCVCLCFCSSLRELYLFFSIFRQGGSLLLLWWRIGSGYLPRCFGRMVCRCPWSRGAYQSVRRSHCRAYAYYNRHCCPHGSPSLRNREGRRHQLHHTTRLLRLLK